MDQPRRTPAPATADWMQSSDTGHQFVACRDDTFGTHVTVRWNPHAEQHLCCDALAVCWNGMLRMLITNLQEQHSQAGHDQRRRSCSCQQCLHLISSAMPGLTSFRWHGGFCYRSILQIQDDDVAKRSHAGSQAGCISPTQPMWLYRHVFAGSSMQLDISKVGAKPAKLQIA